MNLYELLREYAQVTRVLPDAESLSPELGKSLSLFHSCMMETELDHEAIDGIKQVNADPGALQPTHLSQFVVGFLPFNAVTSKSDTNEVLFDVYSFLNWMEKQGINHGWQAIDFKMAMQELSQEQERCLQLSHKLDEESGRNLEDPPEIFDTLTDIFAVEKIEGTFVHLKGVKIGEHLRLRLPDEALSLVVSGDHLDLVLGDTANRWVLLEASQVFPHFTG